MQKERRQVGHDNDSRGQLTGSAQGSSRSYSGISHWASSAASKYLAFPLFCPCDALSTSSLVVPSWGNNEYRCSQAAYHQLGYSMEAVMRFIQGKIHSIREKTIERPPYSPSTGRGIVRCEARRNSSSHRFLRRTVPARGSY